MKVYGRRGFICGLVGLKGYAKKLKLPVENVVCMLLFQLTLAKKY